MKTNDLREQRTTVLARARTAHEADDDVAYQAAETELRAIDARLARAEALDNAARRAAGTPINRGDAHASRELRSQSVLETIRYAMGMPVQDRGRIEEQQAQLTQRAGTAPRGVYLALEAFEKRVLTTAAPSGGPGGSLVADELRPDLYINALTAQPIVAQLGARVLTGLVGNVEIPREKAAPTVAWVAENSALTASDPQFDQLTLSPHHVGALTEISRNMVQQTSPDVESLLRGMMARDIALAIDAAAIAGSGVGAVPQGILNTPGVGSVAFSTDLVTTTALMIGAADLANVEARRAFVSTNGVKAGALKLVSNDGVPIGIAPQFHSEPVSFTNQAPSDLGAGSDEHALIYGDFADLIIAYWSQLDVLVNPYETNAYAKGNVLIRAMASVDVGVRRPKSFVKATGVTVD